MANKPPKSPVAPFTLIETDYLVVGDEEYTQLLEEWAEMVYGYFCQLPENQNLVTDTSMPLAAERTGTNDP